MSSSRFLLPLVVVLALAPIAVGSEKPRVKSEVLYRNSITPPDGFLHQGKVLSRSHACEKNRKVFLYGEGVKKPFASDRTDNAGRWKITMPQDGLSSDYFARVEEDETSDVICKAKSSEHKPLD